jgi:very-short-patch-repair endonuclease
MWRILRQLPVHGGHFRRQVPIDDYVVDFALLRARLIIEVDGDVHAHPSAARRDAIRGRSIVSAGFRLLRFTNSDVLRNPRGVAEVILATLGSASPTTDETHPTHLSKRT